MLATSLAVMAPVVGAVALSPAVPAAAVERPAADQVQLPAVAANGQRAVLSAQITHETANGSFVLVVSVTSSVIAVNGDFSYTTRSTINSIDVPSGAEVAGNGVDSLNNLSFDRAFAATGASAGGYLIDAGALSPEQQAAGDSLLDAFAMLSVGFPREPVAVGASWTSNGTVGSHGVEAPVQYQCSLASLESETYTLEVSYSAAFANQAPEGWVDATVSGSGTLMGSLTNPLVVNGSLYQSVDGIVTAADGTSSPWHNDTSIAVSTTGTT